SASAPRSAARSARWEMEAARLPEAHDQPVVGDARFDAIPARERDDPGVAPSRIARHDLRAAMREDRPRHALGAAPLELIADGRVSESPPSPAPNDRPHDARAVADVETHAAERFGAPRDGEHVGHEEDAGASGADPVPHGRRADRMDDREGLERHARDAPRAPRLDDAPVTRCNREAFHPAPGVGGGVHGTWRSAAEAAGVIRMGVRHENRVWAEATDPPGPVLAAVDHHAPAAMHDQERRVHPMARRARVDAAAGAGEGERHVEVRTPSGPPAIRSSDPPGAPVLRGAEAAVARPAGSGPTSGGRRMASTSAAPTGKYLRNGTAPPCGRRLEGVMSETIRLVDYFYIEASQRPGEAARVLSQLQEAGVNLLAFSGFPAGRRAQLDFVPEDPAAFRTAAKKAGWKPTGPKKVFLVEGEDRAGAMADVVAKLAAAKINITATQAVTAGSGRFGALLWVQPRDVKRAGRALAVGS